MSQKTEISLRNFFIYNSKFGPKEGEEEKKILFYYPTDADIDTKIKDVGLCEAIIKFTNTFTSSDDSCQHLRSQKTMQLFLQPETDFWMIMTINVPSERKEKPAGTEYMEYKSYEVHVKIFRQILRQFYQMFRLFCDKFTQNMCGTEGGTESKVYHLRNKLDEFYSKYLLSLNLQQRDVLDALRSIQYLPVNQMLFLRLHNFIKMIEATFSTIKTSIFLYNDQVVWSGINATDLYSVYEYLTAEIFPSLLAGNTMTRTYSLDSPQCGTFVTGPEHYEKTVRVPKVYVYDDDNKCESYYLVIYRAFSATICLFVEDDSVDNFYDELHAAIGPQLSNIATEIGESISGSEAAMPNLTPTTPAAGPKFLYFNQLTFQHNGNIHHASTKKGKNNQLPADVMNLLTDLYGDSDTGSLEETVLKTLNDYWIVKKQNNWRHFYVIVNKSSTLLEISEEAKRLFDEHTKDIYF